MGEFFRTLRALPALLALAALTACTPTTVRPDLDVTAVGEEAALQREMVLEGMLHDQQRLSRVAYPILKGAVPLCGRRTRPRIGVNFSNVYAFHPDYQVAARNALGLDQHIRLVDVTPGSAADHAGLLVGDRLLEIDGRHVPSGRSAMKDTQALLDRATRDDGAVSFVIQRGEEQLSVNVVADDVCYYPVLLAQGDEINAMADGDHIFITKGMLRFARDDRDLGLVIAHELAHNAMGHIEKQTGNYMLGTLLDLAALAAGVDTQRTFGRIAVSVHSKAFEAEADYVGLYIMALADVDYHGVSAIWRRMAVEHPGSLKTGYLMSHPSSAERFVALERTAEEIDAKRAAGQPLWPEMG